MLARVDADHLTGDRGRVNEIAQGRGDLGWIDGAAEQVSDIASDVNLADTTIKVAWDDWQAMAAGQLDGMTAFMTGKLKIEGDMSNAMQLQGVLAKLRS